MNASDTQARIGPILAVTVCTPDLDASIEAYTRALGYRELTRSRVTAQQSALWQCPALQGCRYALLAPQAADDFVFRFVESREADVDEAFTRHGWNAAELIVAKVDPLADQLVNSPFEIVAPPLDLSFCSDIRAMQIRGPAGEILYLTEFKRPVPGLPAPPARCAVDRTFIVIVGGASLPRLQAFYEKTFGVPHPEPMESRVQTMALAFGLSREHRFRIAALPLAGRCFVEADEMPAAARPLDPEATRFPPGIAMVSFAGVPGGTGARAAPAEPPYPPAARAASRHGVAGELLEIIG